MASRKLIIIEGMDCTGKDTQIKAICNHFPHENFHTLHYHAIKSRTPEEARKLAELTYREMFFIVDQAPYTNFIFNRSHYGEYVYGEMYRGYTDPEYVFEIDRESHIARQLEDAALIVLLNNDFDTLLAREDGDSLSQGDRMKLVQEFERFYDVYLSSGARHKILLNVAGMSIPEVTKKVTSWLDMVYNDSTSVDDRASSPQR